MYRMTEDDLAAVYVAADANGNVDAKIHPRTLGTARALIAGSPDGERSPAVQSLLDNDPRVNFVPTGEVEDLIEVYSPGGDLLEEIHLPV
jgi:hypothetical protein